MKTKISHTMQPVTSGNANMNVPSRVSTITTRLVAMLSLLITMMGGTIKAADEMVFFHVNALGSATAAFNETGDLCWKQHYTPYGEQTNNNDANPPTGCGLIGKDRGYTGHVQDESGLTYMQQRYYDPTIGRFLSVDPVGVSAENPNSYNRYMYANNNPYAYVDPDGRNPDFLLASDPVAYYQIRAEEIGADMFTKEGAQQTAKHVADEALLTIEVISFMTGGGAALAHAGRVAAKGGFGEAIKARDEALSVISNLSKTQQRKIATVVGAFNKKTGKTGVGIKRTGCDRGKCAEDLAAEAVGGKPTDVLLSQAKRPRLSPPNDSINVCIRCQGTFGREQFPPGTGFD